MKRAKQNASSAGPADPAYIGYATVRLVDRDAQVDIPIDETGEITGKVVLTDPDEESESFRPFFVSLESRQLNIHSSTNTDDDGNFQLARLPVGPPYTLNAGATGRIGSQMFYLKIVECDGQDDPTGEVTIPTGKDAVNCTLTLAKRSP